MNQDQNSNTAFSESGTQTNPFTGDLKGEFTSDFGTNTNAVSQMFKGDGMGGGDKKRTIMLAVGGLVVVALLTVLLVFDEEDQGFDDFAESTEMTAESTMADQAADDQLAAEEDSLEADTADPAEDTTASGVEGAADTPAPETTSSANEGAGVAEATAPGSEAGVEAGIAPAEGYGQMASTGSITVASPFDGASLAYDETQGPATFSWSGAADRIVFSRSASMAPIVRSRNVAGRQSYRFLHPHPGNWYWRLENAEGGTPVQSFAIMPPVRRNFPITQPQPGGQIAGNGGVVAWQSDAKIASYKVQLVPQGSSWSSPAHQFGTSGTSIALQGVAPGAYDLRVGAFSEVAGRWEWQVINGVTVQ